MDFPPKVYRLVCHACGVFHEKTSAFISSPLAFSFPLPDGRSLCVPAMGCPTCIAIPGPRETHPIFLAFRDGMTPAARARAEAGLAAAFPEYFALCGPDCRAGHSVDCDVRRAELAAEVSR